MLAPCAGVLAACAVLLLSAPAAAEVSGWLQVERDAGTSRCPDAATLRHAVEQLLSGSPRAAEPSIEVAFSHDGSLLRARLSRVGDAAATRELRDSHLDCETLASAVSTTVALMLETQVTLVEPEPVAVVEPSSETPADAEMQQSPQGDRHLGLGLQLTGGVTLGVLGGTSPVLSGAGVFDGGLWRVSLGASWFPSRTVSFGPGEVRASGVALQPRVCGKLVDLALLDTWTCSGLLVGEITVAARGYSQDFTRSESWLAVPLDLALGGPLSDTPDLLLNWWLAGTVLTPVQRQRFSVQGLGTALQPARVQGMIGLGLEAFTRW